ncbi:hypothetical protein V8C43DRAFT_32388 [Trichoderma afarasin]
MCYVWSFFIEAVAFSNGPELLLLSFIFFLHAFTACWCVAWRRFLSTSCLMLLFGRETHLHSRYSRVRLNDDDVLRLQFVWFSYENLWIVETRLLIMQCVHIFEQYQSQ